MERFDIVNAELITSLALTEEFNESQKCFSGGRKDGTFLVFT